MQTRSLTSFTTVIAILCVGHPAGAENIDTISGLGTIQGIDTMLGLDRRVRFNSRGPELRPFSYSQGIETIAIPDKLLILLQAANEGLAFYAAYRDRNYLAMTTVGAMSLCGGSLRRGIDVVARSSNKVALEDLGRLSDCEVAVLGYLWHTEGKTGSDLYRDFGKHGTWTVLFTELKAMEKQRLIRRSRAALQDLYHAKVTPADVFRAAIASGDPRRITKVLFAIGKQGPDSSSEAFRGSYPVGDRNETQ